MKPDEALLNDIIKRIVSASQPERIIMFGSAATGEMNQNSDIDLLVVKSGVHRRRTTGDIYRSLKGAGYPVDVIVAHPEDLEQYGESRSMVYREALLTGKTVYGA